MANRKRNDKERELWVQNDEGLYLWYRHSGMSMRNFIRANRAKLDECIDAVLDNKKPAHFLAYGG